MKVTSDDSAAVPANVSALARGLERLVAEFAKLRRQALRDVHLTPEAAYLLRLAAQPGGVRLGLFRERLGITEPRASQIAGPLEAAHFVKRNRDASNARARIVQTTDKGRKALAKFDAQLAEALRAELVKGDVSPLQASIADVRRAATPFAQGAEGDDDRKPIRARRTTKAKQLTDDGPTLMDVLDNAQ